MREFINDVWDNVMGYYNKLIDITPKLLLAIATILIAWAVASWVRGFANTRLQKRMHDPLLATFIANLLKSVLIIVGILFMFRIVGLTGMAATVLAGAGISAFIIGFALKDIGENFLAGILLAFKRPFTVGDIIESNGVKGKVITLNLRDTQVKSDGKDIYIPNAMLIKSILINYNRGGFLLQEFVVGLEYGADYEKALELVKKVLHHEDKVSNKDLQNIVVISGIAGAVIQLNIRYWVRTDRQASDGLTRSGLIVKILEALHKEGYVIK
jgi:small conductance mechanosensitive channel